MFTACARVNDSAPHKIPGPGHCNAVLRERENLNIRSAPIGGVSAVDSAVTRCRVYFSVRDRADR
jgi:hypothetical protein